MIEVKIYFFEIKMVAFQIFWISIYRYGLFYALSFILGYYILYTIGQKGYFRAFPTVQKLLTQSLDDLLLVIAAGVIIGGRLGHVLIYGEGYYFSHIAEIFKLREGGMSFIWGILGVVLAVWAFLAYKKMSKQDFFLLFDLILLVVPIGIFFGRFGNFLNQELYGIAISQLPTALANTFQNLGLVHIYSQIDQIPRVNTNFLSMLLEGLTIFWVQLYLFFSQIKKKRRKIWLMATNFLLMYSVIRFGLEYLRADSQMEIIAFLSKSQWFFLLFIAIALLLRWKVVKSQDL